jgi:hypothetical protein
MRKQREWAASAMLLLFAAAASGQTIPDIRDSLEPLVLPPDSNGPLIYVFSAAGILILAILISLIRRSRARFGTNESPEARARRRLSTIMFTGPRALYTELHNIFVEYVESRYRIEASRCTTPELLDLLASTHVMSADLHRSIETFLADCDRAKFSPSELACEQEAAVTECLGLINQVTAHIATVSPPAIRNGAKK